MEDPLTRELRAARVRTAAVLAGLVELAAEAQPRSPAGSTCRSAWPT